MIKTFYITYYSNKDKKHITRQGKHDEKSRYGTSKKGVPYYVYYDLDAHGYRTATTSMESEALMTSFEFYSCVFFFILIVMLGVVA